VQHFGKPVEKLGALPRAKATLDLLPPAWQAELRSRARGDTLRQNLLIAGVIWLVLIAGAFGYLTWLKNRVQAVEREHLAMKPRFAGIEKQMARWESLGPVLDPKRYITEVLHQLITAIPEDKSMFFTSFSFSPREWVAKGEGTTDARFALVTKLKADKELDGFELYTPPEQPLKDDKVTFTVTGKPK
jgi:hypothetical protein